MGVISIKDHIDHCYSNSDGEVIKDILLKNLDVGEKTVLSFDGIDSVSSSFVNSALIDLLDVYSFDIIKSHVTFADTTRSINDVIKRRFSFEVNHRKKLIEV